MSTIHSDRVFGSAHQHRRLLDSHDRQLEQSFIAKHSAIEDLLQDYERLQVENQQLTRYMSDKSNAPEGALNSSKYAVLLLDGSRLQFNEELLPHGKTGGRRLADYLYQSASQTIASETEGWASCQVLYVKYYLNVVLSCQSAVKSGMVRSEEVYLDFLDGFSSHPAIDCVQVGTDKGMVEKFKGSVRGHLSNDSCTAVVIGSSMSNGVANDMLALNNHFPAQADRLYVMSGPEPVPDVLSLNTKAFAGPHDVFYAGMRAASRSTTYSDADSESSSCSVHLTPVGEQTRLDSQSATARSAIGSWATIAKQATASNERMASIGSSADSRPQSRAQQEKAVVIDIASPKPPLCKRRDTSTTDTDVFKHCTRDSSGIYWSPAHTRIDPCSRWYNRDDVERIKKLKLCNVHHLRPPCHNNSSGGGGGGGDKKCAHNHSYRLTAAERETLALVARMSPCQNGPGCEDAGCIYGHNCPAPRHANPGRIKGGATAIKEGKLCIFGVECYFDGEMHYYGD